MNKRRIHIYGSGRGFIITPVCRQPNDEWVELQPLPRISLTRGRSLSTQMARALEQAHITPCTAPKPETQRPSQRYLYMVCLSWHEETLQLHLLPSWELQAEWPTGIPYEQIADHLIAQLGKVLD